MSMVGVALVPCRTKNDLAEIQTLVSRVTKLENIGLDVAERGFGFPDRALRERVNNIVLECLLARMRGNDLDPLFFTEFVISEPEHVHLDTRGNQCDNWLHMFRHAWRRMQRDRQP